MEESKSILPVVKTIDTTGEPITKFSNLADQYLNQGINKLRFATMSPELDQYSNEIGLGPISKQLTADRIKTLLATFALVKLMGSVRSNFMKIAMVGGAGYLALKNRDAISNLFNSSEYIARKIQFADSPVIETPTIITDQALGGRGNCCKCMGDF